MMPNYGTPPVALDHGQGVRVWDADGREYLDFVGGIAVSVARPRPPGDRRRGHRAGGQARPHVQPLHPRARRRGWPSGWSSCSVSPARVFFANSGAEANECAIKLARKHGRKLDPAGGRLEIVACNGSFHGRTLGSLSITGNPAKRTPFEPLPGAGDASSTTATSTALRAAVTTQHRRGLRRVDPRRGRRRAGRARLPGRGPAGLRRDRRAARRRRGAERHRTHRPLVRQPGRGRPPRRDHPGQGPRRRAADRRLHRRRRGRRPVRRRAITAARSAATRSPAPPRSRCSTRSPTSTCSSRSSGSASTSATGWPRSTARSSPGSAAAGCGAASRCSGDHAGAVEAAARDHGLLVNAVKPDVLRLAPPLIVTEAEVDEAVAALAVGVARREWQVPT